MPGNWNRIASYNSLSMKKLVESLQNVLYPDLLSTKPKARSGQVIKFIFYWLFTILPRIDCEGAT